MLVLLKKIHPLRWFYIVFFALVCLLNLWDLSEPSFRKIIFYKQLLLVPPILGLIVLLKNRADYGQAPQKAWILVLLWVVYVFLGLIFFGQWLQIQPEFQFLVGQTQNLDPNNEQMQENLALDAMEVFEHLGKNLYLLYLNPFGLTVFFFMGRQILASIFRD